MPARSDARSLILAAEASERAGISMCLSPHVLPPLSLSGYPFTHTT